MGSQRSLVGSIRQKIRDRSNSRSTVQQTPLPEPQPEPQAAEEPAFSFPKSMTECDDMVAILNARGTVMLNLFFHGSSAQQHIAALAKLAVRMWKIFSMEEWEKTRSHALPDQATSEQRFHL